MNLRRKGMDIKPFCPVCKKHHEDGGHLLFKCKQAKEIWSICGLEKERLIMMAKVSAVEAVEAMLSFGNEKGATVATLLWCWWCERNNIREGKRGRPSVEIAWTIQHQAEEFWKLGKVERKAPVAVSTTWKPPGEDWIKVNVDGAFKPDVQKGGWGAVLRDSDGDVVACAGGHFPFLHSALHAEALGAVCALQIASNHGMGKVLLETDALLLKNAI
jgi:hypothetical protein